VKGCEMPDLDFAEPACGSAIPLPFPGEAL